jgi:hypothetical protein
MAHIYDYAIIGSGLTGLSIAAALSRETSNIALLESSEVAGGNNRMIKFPTGPINNGLRFVPETALSAQAMEFLETLMNEKVVAGTLEEAPVCYESGHLKTFLGFGDNPPPFYEELAYFSGQKRFELVSEPYHWAQNLFSQFKGEFMPRSYVTKFHMENDRVTHVTINGAKTLHAQNFIFCGTVKDLALLLPEEAISIRNRTKLSKSTYWTALCLDICHTKQVTDSAAMHVLNGTTQDEIGPCVGRFLPSTEVEGQTLQASQWMTFIEQEVTEDSEIVGMTLKKIKRQIKRAYPDALDNLKLERIFVAPIIAGDGEIKLNANFTLPSLENLWISSATVNKQKNLVGSLLQAQLVLASLGFNITNADIVSETSEEETAEAEL